MTQPASPQAYDTDAPTQTRPGTPPQEQPSAPQFELGDLAIDRAGEIPIGVQLAWALRARIGDGRLRAGQRLPGLRELADMLGINANTARGVYQRLEREGLIDSRQGTGTFVASAAVEPSAVGDIAAGAAYEARRTGVDPRDVAAALYVATEPRADPTAVTAERRRDLRAQIAALEQALSEIQANHPDQIPTPVGPPRPVGPRLLGVEDLELVRAWLVRRLAAAGSLLEISEDVAPKDPGERQVGAAEQDATVKAANSKKRPARVRATPRPSTA